MREHSGTYVPRDVEPAVLAHVASVLAEPTAAPAVVLLVGAPGDGVRVVLEHGVVPQLEESSGVPPVTVSGTWHPTARVQVCFDEATVPADPPSGHAVKPLLLVATTDATRLPPWVLADPGTRSFGVGNLTLAEAEALLEALLGGTVDPATVRRLGRLAGFVPGMLETLAEECRHQGCLERIGAAWQLTEDPVRCALMPLVRAELAALPVEAHGTLFRLALAEPAHPDSLDAADAAAVERLVRDGDLFREQDGLLAFRAPGVAAALRFLSPAEEQDRIHSRACESGALRLDTIRWAQRKGLTLPVPALLAFAQESLHRHDWDDVVVAAEFLEDAPAPADAAEAAERCRLHLAAAYAARFVPDTDVAQAQLDLADDLLADLAPADLPDMHAEIQAARADLLHFSLGDLDAALRTLDTHDAKAGTHASSSATLASHRIVHLVYGGRVREARECMRSDQRAVRRGPRRLRLRVALAETLALAAEGRPQRGLRKTTLAAVQHATSRGRAVWADEEIRVSYVVCALGSDGPAAYPSLAKMLRDTREDLFRPDLITFYLARATWLLLEGRVGEAHRLGETALGSVDLFDPSGVRAGLVALVAETAALTGDRARATELLERFPSVPLRSAGIIEGGVEAHLASARLLLGRPHEGTALRRRAARFADDGRFGFAAETLYAGVRAGLRRAATDLREIGGLDGKLHAMRIAHAEALLAEDAMALLEVSRRLDRAGLTLYAAEAAASAAAMTDAPDAVRRRAEDRIAAFLERESVPGNGRLRRSSRASDAVELTPREREVSSLIAEGLTNAEIAERLGLSLRTVEGHIARLYRKTGAGRRAPRRAGVVVRPRGPQDADRPSPLR